MKAKEKNEVTSLQPCASRVIIHRKRGREKERVVMLVDVEDSGLRYADQFKQSGFGSHKQAEK